MDALRAALRADAANVARALLGEPNKAVSNKRTLRWGSKGSLSVEILGSKKGLWFTHEGSEGSDLLGLIRHVKACHFPDAVDWASRFTGIVADNEERQPQQEWRSEPSQAEQEARTAEAAEAEADEAKRIAFAKQIAGACVPLPGSLGEIYLKQTRGIPAPGAGWPEAIRWHAGYRALVAVATDADGAVRAVQRVHVTPSGEKISQDEVAARNLPGVKVTNGVTGGAVVRLPGDPVGPLLIAEGPETGLSVYTSTGHETWIALGSVAKVTPPISRKVVIVSDDNPPTHDARYGQAAKALRKAIRAWRVAGVDLVVATPWQVRRRDRSDFADVILQRGVDAVRERVEEALSPTGETVERVGLAEGRRIVARAVASFFRRVDDASADFMQRREADDTALLPMPFCWGVRVEVGVGKSHEAREQIAATLIAMRERGDDRAMVLALPMHALSDEQAERFRSLPAVQEAGLRVEVWRGREALDPAHPDYQHPDPIRSANARMCGMLDDVREAQSVGLSAQSSCCKRRVKTHSDAGFSKVTKTCALFEVCSYQAQARREADLWIMASDLLWHARPAVMGEIATVIVDEGAWRKGLQGAEPGQGDQPRHISLSLDSIEEELGQNGDNRRLADLRRQLLDAFRALPNGPVRRVELFDLPGMRLTADSASEALKLEWARKVDTLFPGQSKEDRRTALIAAEGNRTIPRFAMLWNGLRVLLEANGPEASGWLELALEDTRDGPIRVIRLKGRRDIADGWKVPTLLLDALLPVDLVRPFWPDIELVADVRVQAPHQHVRQVVDRAFSLSMLGPLEGDAAKADPEEAQRRTNRLHDLRAILIRNARHYAPGRVLVVLQKRVKKALTDLGSLPGNLELAHHNSVAGRDEWRDVAALIVVGRTQPPPAGIKRIAEALTGKAATHLADWYQRADAVREMADGSTIQAETERHPDSLAEEIRWQTCEGELIQIVGRARGVNRTAADPVDVLVLTDVPLPIPLAGTLDAVELTPGPADHMLAAGGVVLGNPADAVLAYPFLWANREAAKKALQRGKLGTFPYKELSIGECPQLRRIDYKAAGQGKSAAVAGFDPMLCPDPETFLRERLGSLAWCRIEGEDQPDPEPPKPKKSRRAEEGVADGVYPNSDAPPPPPPPPAEEIHFAGAAMGRDEPPFPAPEPAADADDPEPLVCDAPWLHVDAPAFLAEDGAVIIPNCPYCGGRHRHHGFGHRLAHCDRQAGRGYVLRRIMAAPIADVSSIVGARDGPGGGWPAGP